MNILLKSYFSKAGPSPTLRINETCKKLSQEGKKVFKFGFQEFNFGLGCTEKNKFHASPYQYF